MTDLSVVILAGGKASRMLKQNKGLIEFNKKPLVHYVIEATKGFSKQIFISANNQQQVYSKLFSLLVLSDDTPGFQGPLSGIVKALGKTREYLLILPCDTPFVEAELIARLVNSGKNNKAQAHVAHDGKSLQPAFALIKADTLDDLRQFMANNGRKLADWLERLDYQIVDMSDHPEWFVNINSQIDFARFCRKTMYKDTPILGFVGFSGTGKTTLLSKLIASLRQHKINVGLIKHAHHDFDIDTPGKDSYVLRKSGARQVMVASDKRFALMVEAENYIKPELDNLLEKFTTDKLDLILIESFKSANINKIEVNRQELEKSYLYLRDSNIIAIATDLEPAKIVGKLALDLNDIGKLTEFVLSYLRCN